MSDSCITWCYTGGMNVGPATPIPIGYVVLHGDVASLGNDSTEAPGLEVVVARNGRPFSTMLEAITYGKVMCSGDWRVVVVNRSA